jgi:hypothetical protein
MADFQIAAAAGVSNHEIVEGFQKFPVVWALCLRGVNAKPRTPPRRAQAYVRIV